jgi:hypothetical protein
MTAFDAYDASADLLNVLRADRAGQRLAALLPLGDAQNGGPDAAASHISGPRQAPRPDQSRHRPLTDSDGTAGAPPAAWATVLDSMVRSGLRARLLHHGGVFTTADPHGLSQALEASHRFRRDTRIGSLFHHPRISFREVAPTDSLHVVIDGNTVCSHIDRVSPLNLDPDHRSHYSPTRVVAHNLTGIADDVARRLTGRRRTRPR